MVDRKQKNRRWRANSRRANADQPSTDWHKTDNAGVKVLRSFLRKSLRSHKRHLSPVTKRYSQNEGSRLFNSLTNLPKILGTVLKIMLVIVILTVMIQEAQSIRSTQGFVDVPLSTELPDVDVPGANISAKTILRYLQEFAPFRYARRLLGVNPIRVGGEAFLRGEQVTINLRIARDNNDGVAFEAKTISGSLKDVDSLITQTSQYILADAEVYVWAVYLYRKKRTDEALAQIQYCLHQDPARHAHLALTLWALILMDQEKYDEAIEKLNAATKDAPEGEGARELAAMYNDWGLALLNEGKVVEAIAKFEEAVRHDPNHALTYNNYGNALLKQKEKQKGIEMLERALRLDPDLSIAYYNLAETLSDDNADDAIAYYLTAIKLDPDLAEAYSGLGRVLVDRGSPADTAKAIENLDNAIRHNPELASAYSNRGLAWTNYAPDAESAAADPKSASVRTTMFGKAIVDLKRSVELYEKQMKTKRSDEVFKEACAITYNNLGWAYEELENYDLAVEHYDNAIRVNPKHYFSYTGKGDALRKARKFDAASAAYEKVIQTSESSARDKFVAYEGEGLVFFKKCPACDSVRRKSDLERSISMFEAALRIASDAKVSREARDRVSDELNKARGALENL